MLLATGQRLDEVLALAHDLSAIHAVRLPVVFRIDGSPSKGYEIDLTDFDARR